jgi:hypothetical protein
MRVLLFGRNTLAPTTPKTPGSRGRGRAGATTAAGRGGQPGSGSGSSSGSSKAARKGPLNQRAQPKDAPPAAPHPTREQFEALVHGAGEDELRALVAGAGRAHVRGRMPALLAFRGVGDMTDLRDDEVRFESIHGPRDG